MIEKTTCQELTGSGRGNVQNTCGRPIVEGGLCSRHLAGKRRSDAATERWRTQRQLREDEKAESSLVANELTALGFPSNGAYGDSVCMTRDVARQLIERLRSS